MTTLRRMIAVTAAAALTLALAPPPAGATTQADTVAVAVNTRDGGSVFRLAFSVRRVMDETVDQDNAAVAYASCTDCETVAISFQVVLAMSDPDVVTTDNLALAVNQECSLCTTYANATQFVLGTGGIVRFTAEGQQRLAALRTKLLALRQEDLTLAELDAVVEEARTELKAILETELVLVRAEETGQQDATTSSSPSTTTTTSTTTSAPTSSSTTSSSTTTTSSTSTSTTTTTTAGD